MKALRSTISRRHFLGRCASLAGALFLPPEAEGQGKSNFNVKQLSPHLAKEFESAYLLTISPNGREMCLYFTRHPNESFIFKGGRREGDPSQAKRAEEALSVVEIGAWKAIYAVRLKAKAFRSSFFSDDVLYAYTLPFKSKGGTSSEHIIIDLRDLNLEEGAAPPDNMLYYAAGDHTLIGTVLNEATSRYEALVRLALPGYRELVRVPFAVSPREQYANDTDLFFSADRTIFGYAAGHTLVCRRTKDLGIIWTQAIEQEFFGASRLAISANGSRVAAAIIDTAYLADQRKYYISLYDGKDGSPLARLPVNGYAGLALSPDGELIAAGRRTMNAKTREVQLFVDLYNVGSAKPFASLLHDTVPPGREQSLNAGFGYYGIQFTSDGTYLITSSNRVKVWLT